MPEFVPAGTATNAGQPLAGVGQPVREEERVPSGVAPDTTAAIEAVGAPAQE